VAASSRHDLRAAGSPEEVKAATGNVQEVWNETQPEVPFGVAFDTLLWGTSVHGIVATAQSALLLDDAWVDG
jgi:hypothetical protein